LALKDTCGFFYKLPFLIAVKQFLISFGETAKPS